MRISKGLSPELYPHGPTAFVLITGVSSCWRISALGLEESGEDTRVSVLDAPCTWKAIPLQITGVFSCLAELVQITGVSSCLMILVSWLGVSGADNQSVQLLEHLCADNQRVWCLVLIARVSSCLRISAPGLEESGADNQHVQWRPEDCSRS